MNKSTSFLYQFELIFPEKFKNDDETDQFGKK